MPAVPVGRDALDGGVVDGIGEADDAMSRPLSYLQGAGAQSAWVTPLLLFTLAVSIIVIVLTAAFVLGGSLRARANGGDAETRGVAIARSGNGVRWIWIGIGISFVPLLASLIWTVAVLAHVGPLPRNPRLTIDVTARQWWWDVRYDGSPPDRIFRTANEIHVPLGEPVLLRLHGEDVIHSFWVPRLAGKMDVIPGQTNLVWIQADVPGRYLGRCAEFCGAQHAHMAFQVVAEPRTAFERWRRAQLQTAPPPATPAQASGLALFTSRCGVCHAIRGSDAQASVGPDLSHLMSRATLAAGTLPNNRPSLMGWIENPQSIKPGAQMPDQGLSASDLNDVSAYLETLR
jgi:cytochrome c oxidase subunit 2